MAVVTLPEVQQWLETTKMSLAAVDPELSESARLVVFGKVSGTYDTSEWVDVATTPKLIRATIGKLVAAWEYLKAYGEEDESTYGSRMERQVYELLKEIDNGNVLLEEYPEIAGTLSEPVFYPNDESNASEVYDASGNYIALNDDVKFRMAGGY